MKSYIIKKTRDGYRKNEHAISEAQAIVLTYQPNANFSIRAQWARSKYNYRIPGPLTDSIFYSDSRQTTRSRNYFNHHINVPSVTVNWRVTASTKLQLTSSAVLGSRNSVQFDKPTNITDSIVTVTRRYNKRQVDIDCFKSYTTELRLLQQYH